MFQHLGKLSFSSIFIWSYPLNLEVKDDRIAKLLKYLPITAQNNNYNNNILIVIIIHANFINHYVLFSTHVIINKE